MSSSFAACQNSNLDWHLAGLLDQAAERYADRPFIVGPGALTYGRASSQSRRIAAWLRREGVKRGDRVMIITMNRPEVPLMVFGVARIGAIFCVLNNTIKAYGLRQIVSQVKPSVVLLDKTTAELANEVGDATIVWADNGSHRQGGVGYGDVLAEPDPGAQPFPGIDLDSVCLLYTSGSTGVPRGVTITHDNILFTTAAIQERLCYQAEDVVGVFLPLSFDYGLYQVFLSAAAGASVFIGRPEFADLKLVSKLAAYDISVLPGVPTLFAAMLKVLSRHPRSLPKLRSVTNTGAHLPLAYIAQMQEMFPDLQIFAMYGLTECKRVSILRASELGAKLGSVGRPLAGTEAYVVGEDGQRLPPDSIGELVVRGRHVTKGYWRAPKETRQRFRQSAPEAPRELYTGDLCRMDADGYIYFVGRNDSQLKHRGFRISPLEIEAAACDIEGVSEAALVQVKDRDLLHLFVTVTETKIGAPQVIEILAERLEPFKVPEQVSILSELPKTPNRKLDRKRLIELAQGT